MNRPRNRQPRNNQPRGGQRGGHSTSPRPPPAYRPVPNIQQVVPGASVSIVLKEDQPTGREVQGVVQDLLTRGDHPRGIKVRLQDGRVGRVQRMSGGTNSTAPAHRPAATFKPARRPPRDIRLEDEALEGPPPRTLADFLPDSGDVHEGTSPPDNAAFNTATAKCPICGLFEGDEIAVSHHVESHLT